ncbi:Protein SPT2 homolog [Eumeta japonica]|uniref:Protein SPT2 homolog n=1 Tax=Eumeta variegata TaxID=151549 RepID=A0A4C1SXZ9_EUMVA|nr:Protein SPT2 homolog [Eumeta japonica]
MEFRETLLAAQRIQQEKSTGSMYYKARFDPPKKEHKPKDRLSENIKRFLAKKEEEERQKQLEAKRKKEELQAMRDPKMLRKIQKTLKVIKSANKSVLADAVDRDNTAVTLQGPDQPDQDDYGYESQEAAALYQKMMEKYSKLPDEPKFPMSNKSAKRDLAGTRERVKFALQHEDEPVPHKRKRKTADQTDREASPVSPLEADKEVEEKCVKPKIKKIAPPPMDFNQLLKLAEQKKSEPLEVAIKKPVVETETERPMTKKQKREYEEEMARRMRRQQRLEQSDQKFQKDERPLKEKERKSESSTPGFTRIPKLSDKNVTSKIDTTNTTSQKLEKSKDRLNSEAEKYAFLKEKLEKQQREKIAREQLEKLKVTEKHKSIDKVNKHEKDKKIKERLNEGKSDRPKLNNDIRQSELKISEKSKDILGKPNNKQKSDSNNREQIVKHETNKNIHSKIQNTYRIDKNANEKKISISNKTKETKVMNGHSHQDKPALKHLNNSKQSVEARDKIQDKQNTERRDKISSKQSAEIKGKILAKQKALFGNHNENNSKLSNSMKPVNGSVKTIDCKSKTPDPKSLAPKLKSEQKISHEMGAKPGTQLKVPNHFDFDKYMKSLGKPVQKTGDRSGLQKADSTRQFPPADVKRKHPVDEKKRKQMQKKRVMNSDSEYDSEMDDFIDDGEEDLDYSKHIKEIFGYDKSKYRDMDDDDDPTMESSFSRQMREEFISKKIGIMEDLEDMRQEAIEKKMKMSPSRKVPGPILNRELTNEFLSYGKIKSPVSCLKEKPSGPGFCDLIGYDSRHRPNRHGSRVEISRPKPFNLN